MKKVCCYIRQNYPGRDKWFPWLMETYPDHKNIARRDFECLTIAEARRIARAVYGDRAGIHVQPANCRKSYDELGKDNKDARN